MNKELNDKLQKEFPRLFNRIDAARHESCMAVHGCTCGPGWFGIIHDLATKLEKEFQSLPEEEQERAYYEDLYVFEQVKQKFCILRIYFDSPTERMKQLIEEAENASCSICEDCGGDRTGPRSGIGMGRAICQYCVKLYSMLEKE